MYHRLEVDRQLWEIRKAPLKPYQRMDILRFYLIPKMMHSLTLGQVHPNTLKRLDTMIRQAVRAWLRLPNNTPTSYFHTAVLKGGIGVPCLSSTIPFLKRSRFEKLLVSQVPILRNVVTDSSFGPILRNMNIPVRVQGITVSSQEETQVRGVSISIIAMMDVVSKRPQAPPSQVNGYCRQPLFSLVFIYGEFICVVVY